MSRRLIILFSFAAFLVCPFARAGRIVLTGHDDDFHQSAAASAAMTAFLKYVRATAPNPTLPVLSFDHGSELQTFLTSLGVTFTNIDPDVGVPAASNFDVTKFSAMVVASDATCVGCDNDSTSSANLQAAAAPIASFFDAGGGIIGLAAANNVNYYAFLPASASVPGTVSCSSCFMQTPAGAAKLLPAVNGDFPHNFFPFPGTGGVAAAYQVFETYTGPSSSGTLTNQPFGLFFDGKIVNLTGATKVPMLGVPGMILLFLLLAGVSTLTLHKAP